MRKYLLFIFVYLSVSFGGNLAAQETDKAYQFLLTGASFATSHNGWFEIGCRKLSANGINRAVAGESIANTANKMADGTLWSFEEFDKLDALVIMHVHNRDVFDPSQLLPDYKDYTTPFDRSNYARIFDYVIKRYISECYALKDNPQSAYYGTKAGKPAVIVLCTDWHDARTTYNTAIRKLAQKWGLPLVEFDTSIGFSKNTPHPATGQQPSLLYAKDDQTIEGTKYGWHPDRGEDKYIQQRMAAIFVDLMKKVLPVK